MPRAFDDVGELKAIKRRSLRDKEREPGGAQARRSAVKTQPRLGNRLRIPKIAGGGRLERLESGPKHVRRSRASFPGFSL